jgi:hypothetical protein
VTWHDERLELATVYEDRISLGGGGLLIVPSAFYWQGIGPIIAPPWQPALLYPARGLELLWQPGTTTPGALSAVIGRSRARLLALLDAPRARGAVPAYGAGRAAAQRRRTASCHVVERSARARAVTLI